MAAYECISGFVTAAGAVLTNWTMNAGDSLTVRLTPGVPYLLNAWTDRVAPGSLAITSPKLHDMAQGLMFNSAGLGDPLRNCRQMERLFPGDVLTVQQSGSAGVGDIDAGTIVLYYDSLPGLDQNLITWAQFRKRYVRSSSAAAILTPIMTGGYSPSIVGGPGGGQNFKGNTEYACMGYTQNDLPVGTVCFKGPETKNLRIPLPQCANDTRYTSEWFLMLACQFPDLPMIPVINSESRNAYQLETVHSSVILPAGTAVFQLAQLS